MKKMLLSAMVLILFSVFAFGDTVTGGGYGDQTKAQIERTFPVHSNTNVFLSKNGSNVHVSWTLKSGTHIYFVFRNTPILPPFNVDSSSLVFTCINCSSFDNPVLNDGIDYYYTADVI